jgi:hypothetical protein
LNYFSYFSSFSPKIEYCIYIKMYSNNNTKDLLRFKLQQEYENIIKNKWCFLHNDYNNNYQIYHRTNELKQIRNMNQIKEDIVDKIGILAPFVFITDFCSKFRLPGPYNDIDKVLIVLYHMICGASINQMISYLDVSNYFRIYRFIFIKKYDELNEWINNLMYNCFSNKNIRLLTSYLNNPELVKHVTLLLDGHHNRIIYENIDIDKKELYSWKLQKPGLNTQFIIDLNQIVVYISESLPCKDNNDDLMFINNIEFKNFFTIYDNICFDGLYENTLQETIQKYEPNIGMDISNFTYPVKKIKNKDMDENEKNLNKYIASFRSTIETYFAHLGQTFKRFCGQNNTRVTKLKTYNIQLRLACLLLNIKRFSELSNLILHDKYSAWTKPSFDYLSNTGIIPKTEPIIFRFNSIENIKNKQMDLLNAMMYNNTIQDNENKNKRHIHAENNDSFEVQYIINSRVNEITHKKEYLVKWKKYSKKYNSWIKESDFNEKEIIEEYNKSMNES